MKKTTTILVLLISALTISFLGCKGDKVSNMPGLNWATINVTRIEVRTNAVDLASVTINAPASGYAVVRFDGDAIASTGDRLVLAASDQSKNWVPNDGNVSFEGDDNSHPFSHTRIYPISSAGSHTYYALAHNYVNTGGTGRASIYGIVTVEYFSKKY